MEGAKSIFALASEAIFGACSDARAPNFGYFSIAKAKRMRIFSKFFLRSEANEKFFSLVRSEAKAKISQKLRKKSENFSKIAKKKRNF